MAAGTLRKGFTTGAAAAAAVKAALTASFSNDPDQVDITFLTGEKKTIPVYRINRRSGSTVEAIVIKDAGDDPDVTHKAQIGAVVTLSRADTCRITISGGKGVGKITKPGLELSVGEPAINPGPRKMIRRSVDEVLGQFHITGRQIDIEIFVPRGEELAKKTLNARLGIIGGISILGTTGIVTPMSHDAYVATIKSSVNVAAANQIDTLVFTTGRRSERFAMARFGGFKEEAFIQTGDFFKASLDMARGQGQIKKIIYTIFFGKAVKMALGFEHTHAAKSELTLKQLAEWALTVTASPSLAKNIETANTARHAFSFIYPDHPDLITLVGQKIKENASVFSAHKLDIRVIIFDFNGTIVFDSK